MKKVPIANDICACKPFLHGDLLDQFLYEGGNQWIPNRFPVSSSLTEARLPPCGFLLGGRKQTSVQWSCFLKVIPHEPSHFSIILIINKGPLNNHMHFGKVTKHAFPSGCPFYVSTCRMQTGSCVETEKAIGKELF